MLRAHRSTLPISPRLVLPVLTLFASLAGSTIARADDIVVDSLADTTDPNLCTLRSALLAADNDAVQDGCTAGNGDDQILVPAGTIEVSQALTMATNVSVVGQGADVTILHRDGGVIFNPTTGTNADIAITDLTVTGASQCIRGFHGGRLDLTRVRVTGCTGDGVLVWLNTDTTVTDCEIDNNLTSGD